VRKKCEGCILVRYIKPAEGNRSFCVSETEAETVDSNIYKVNRVVLYTQTHREKVAVCDHLNQFVQSVPNS
jgi:hypothetical protein